MAQAIISQVSLRCRKTSKRVQNVDNEILSMLGILREDDRRASDSRELNLLYVLHEERRDETPIGQV